MISFDNFKMTEGNPIYMQIILYIKRGIVAGRVKDNDELPSRRTLSASLGVNPNTVQKAYKILEDENLISSHLGSKSFMVLDDEKIEKISAELLESDAKAVVLSMKQMGISKEKAVELLEKYWE